jgi:hypothetical protein
MSGFVCEVAVGVAAYFVTRYLIREVKRRRRP